MRYFDILWFTENNLNDLKSLKITWFTLNFLPKTKTFFLAIYKDESFEKSKIWKLNAFQRNFSIRKFLH